MTLASCSSGEHAFRAPAGSDGTFGLEVIHPGETIWIGLPVMPVVARAEVRVQGVALLPASPRLHITGVFVMSIRDDHTHVSILEARYFKRYGFHPVGAATAVPLQPGEHDEYLCVRATFAGGPKALTLERATISFTTNGQRAAQTIPVSFVLGTTR